LALASLARGGAPLADDEADHPGKADEVGGRDGEDGVQEAHQCGEEDVPAAEREEPDNHDAAAGGGEADGQQQDAHERVLDHRGHLMLGLDRRRGKEVQEDVGELVRVRLEEEHQKGDEHDQLDDEVGDGREYGAQDAQAVHEHGGAAPGGGGGDLRVLGQLPRRRDVVSERARASAKRS
jgi:hypothetical protein